MDRLAAALKQSFCVVFPAAQGCISQNSGRLACSGRGWDRQIDTQGLAVASLLAGLALVVT